MSPRIDSIRTVPAEDGARRGRLAKATQFQSVAEDVLELAAVHTGVADAAVTLFVHAGIAAADAICAAALGKYARGQDHGEAVGLLNSVDPESARALNTLLGMKTRAGYGHTPVSGAQLARAERAARQLVDRARL